MERKIFGTNYTENEITDILYSEIENILNENDIDIDIIEIWLHGSRLRGNNKPDSDLDAVIFYKGKIREDTLFNILCDYDIKIDNIKIDFNPVEVYNDNIIKKYKLNSNEYDKTFKYVKSYDEFQNLK